MGPSRLVEYSSATALFNGAIITVSPVSSFSTVCVCVCVCVRVCVCKFEISTIFCQNQFYINSFSAICPATNDVQEHELGGLNMEITVSW